MTLQPRCASRTRIAIDGVPVDEIRCTLPVHAQGWHEAANGQGTVLLAWADPGRLFETAPGVSGPYLTERLGWCESDV